ncbi:hypothetical protein C8R43DRAFT_1128234 [Mycena crocata]|nr:hypothetical protein C8R43DRAFT_1128234 [Mycena crocata]
MYPSPSPTRSLVRTLSPFSPLTALQSYTTLPLCLPRTLLAGDLGPTRNLVRSSIRHSARNPDNWFLLADRLTPAQTATYHFVTLAPECISLTDENRDPSFFGSPRSFIARERQISPAATTDRTAAAAWPRTLQAHFGRKGHTDERTDAFTASSSPRVDRVTDVPSTSDNGTL